MKECKIEIGELVELKSGSLKMTVSNLKKNSDGRIMADCVWFNTAKDFPQNFSSPYDGSYSFHQIGKQTFPIEILTKVTINR